ncbi:hypothetical protein BGZ59_000087, partial [Podila verticillata]
QEKPWLQVHERWFPGCHYDLGRQRFQFFPNGKDVIQKSIAWALRPLGKVIEPNDVLADLVLKWMLESIKTENPDNNVILNIDAKIRRLIANISNASKTGSGDVYDRILEYGTALQNFFDLRLIYGTIAATRDRRIGDYNAEVTRYDIPNITYGNQTIETLARITNKRYPSDTFENFLEYAAALQ